MAMSLNFPTPFNSMSIINPDLVDSHKQPSSFTSTSYWWNYYGVRAEAFTEFIKFMEPQLKRCEEDIRKFEATEDTNFVRSIKMELDSDTAMLNFMKLNNRIYGSMYTRVKDFEAMKKDDEANIKKMADEIRELQDIVINGQLKQKQDEIKLEKKITKLENLIQSSNSDKIDEKARKIMKFSDKYSEHIKELEQKILELRQKSDEAMAAFETHKSETISTLVQIYQETVVNRNECFDEFRKAAEHLRGGSAVALEIDAAFLIVNAVRNQRKSIRLHRFQTIAELISNSQPCADYFHRINTPPDVATTGVPAPNDTINEIHALRREMAGNERTMQSDQRTDVKHFCVDEQESPDEHPANDEKNIEPAVKSEAVATSTDNNGRKRKMAGKSEENIPTEPTLVMPFRQQESDEEEWDSCIPHGQAPRPLPKQPKASVNNTEREKLDVFITDIKPVSSSKTAKPIGPLPEPKTAIKIPRQGSDVINPRKIDTKNTELPSDQPHAINSSEQLTRLSQLDLSFDLGDEESISASQSMQPFPSKPSSCWEAETDKTEKQASFTPYKTRVLKAYKKNGEDEMSVKKGEIIKIISRPDFNGYVMARKKRFFRYKTGLIPIFVF